MKEIQKLFKNLDKKDFLFMIITSLFVLINVYFELKMPDYMSEITRLVETEGSEMNDIIHNGGFMLLCALGSMGSMIVASLFAAKVAADFSKNTRKALFDKVENLSIHEVKKFKTSSLVTRTTNDITQLQMLLAMGSVLLIKAPVTAIWALIKILNKNVTWTIIVGAFVIVILVILGTITSIVFPKFDVVQKLTDRVNELTRENLIGIRVIRAFNAENYQENKFNDTNDKLTKTQLFIQKMFSIMNPVMYLVMYGLTLFIYYFGANMINSAALTNKLSIFSDMVVFSSYGMQVIMSFLMLAMIYTMIPRARVSASRINEVLETDISVKNGTKTIDDVKEHGTVEFKDVSFKYPDGQDYVIKDINFKVNKGEIVAFIGATGCGKTTLINLIPRLYDTSKGSVYVDGINVKDYNFYHLNNIVGYVPQKAIMFDGTVKSNISFGSCNKVIDDKKINEAIRVSQAEEFVSKMDKGINSHIARGGTNVSGGQKQRLSIARAVARDPEIYIFDDTFSALDYKTDSELRKELKKYTKGATTLIVAQRIGTIMNADKIIVIDNGKCVGMGTHKELMKTCEVYKQIALSQLSKEEL